ncbi:MAG: asparagine synthase (glutamine-hydrolyzing) [Candidatus Eisenbacteria bacterium]|uniref:asparagine synthase (glutamine-hydrolyzing) n=1 Tax=Eiseniibacteriota bacterium TaxID=2212470 RepID=A0A7Y2EED7_UNCEI|nr:asparagine synthase (glutamine-hydrolyzing) [Candidatus Eisenbacteria bacterium]
MCGIAGVIHLDGQKQVDSGLLERMGETLVHRGPDAGAIWSSGSVGFSHRRLAILDLVGGDQPKRDPAGNILSFNGEIYNYIEVRETLKELGHDFETQSDTEVLLTAYRQWGIDCLDHLNGMWAFSIWDKANDRVFLARDRLGEKPLYYANFNNSFWFASEIKALLAAGVPDDPDYSMLEVYLSSGYISAPHTFYKHIRSLPAGYRMVVEGGQVTESKYWDLPEIDEEAMRTDQEKVDEEFEHLLTDSVRIRMRSDVPYGAFLSGGLDSSSIVALMSEISSHPVETFTVGFTDKDFDERQLARAVSEKFKTKHSEAVLELKDFEESLA